MKPKNEKRNRLNFKDLKTRNLDLRTRPNSKLRRSSIRFNNLKTPVKTGRKALTQRKVHQLKVSTKMLSMAGICKMVISKVRVIMR